MFCFFLNNTAKAEICQQGMYVFLVLYKNPEVLYIYAKA